MEPRNGPLSYQDAGKLLRKAALDRARPWLIEIGISLLVSTIIVATTGGIAYRQARGRYRKSFKF